MPFLFLISNTPGIVSAYLYNLTLSLIHHLPNPFLLSAFPKLDDFERVLFPYMVSGIHHNPPDVEQSSSRRGWDTQLEQFVDTGLNSLHVAYAFAFSRFGHYTEVWEFVEVFVVEYRVNLEVISILDTGPFLGNFYFARIVESTCPRKRL